MLSLRGRLLALSNDLSREIAESCDADQRAIAALIDAHVRSALNEISQMPERVTGSSWMRKIDDEWTPSPAKRATSSKRAAKGRR
jgi:hypothetical protein